MTTRITRGVLIVILVSLIAFPLTQCRKKTETGQESSAKPAAIVGDLQVLHVSPQGPTTAGHMAEQVVVIFDHPMVALQVVPEGDGSSFLRIEPSVPGKFRWVGTKALAFTPSGRFPYATEVKVTIPAGTTSLDGYSLKKDYAWAFLTISPDVVSHSPADDEQWVRLDEKVRLVFNQPVDPGKCKPFLTLTDTAPDGKRATLDFSVDRLSAKEIADAKLGDKADSILLLEPSGRLKPDHTYTVGIRAGLPGREGPLGLAEDVSFTFSTFKSFEFAGIEPQTDLNPYESLKVQFNNQVAYKELVSKVRFSPAVKIPDYYFEWDSANDTVWLNLPFAPETSYSLTIPADLQDEFGNKLGKDVTVKFSTTAYPASVRMTTGHGVVEAYSKGLYSFQALNTNRVKLQAGLLSKDGVLPLLSRNKVFWSSEDIEPGAGFFAVEKTIAFKTIPNKRQLVPIDLRDILKRDHGLLFLQLDTGLEDKWDRYPKALLQVTELGISGKFSAENNTIWVTELRTGNPVPDARVEIRDPSNRVCWTGQTDKDGKVTSPGARTLGIKPKDSWDKPEQYVFASRGDDTAFISSEWGTGVEPYRFGIDYDYQSEPEWLGGYLFTERGIYRAGEPVHVKGFLRVRNRGQWALPPWESVRCTVMDSLQKSVYEGDAALDAFGSFNFDLTTEDSAALGNYSVRAAIPSPVKGGSPRYIYGNFRVEAYRPAEFEVHLRSVKDSFVFGEDYEAEVRASYLFGGAMAGQKADWSLRLNPSSFAPPAPKGYLFGNAIDWEEEASAAEGEGEGRETSRLLASGSAVLDAQGLFRVKAPLVPEKEKDSVLATLEATVHSPSRRTISNRIQTVVHRGEFYIGLKPETTFLKKGDKLNLSVITLEPSGSPVERKVDLKLFRREWRSVRKAGSGGRFEWVSEKVDTEAGSQRVSTRKEPVAAAFTPDKSGFYIITARSSDSKKNTITSSTYLYVTGDDYVAWERRDDDSIELVPDSETYRPGDRARILVKSPYEKAKALVTVEREFVLESRVLEIKGSTSQIELPIRAEHIPNVFVSVLLVQGRTEGVKPGQTDDVGKPSFKIGYASLNVDPTERSLKVGLKTDAGRYQPRDKVSLKLHVTDQKDKGQRASVAVAVVDVGVLNLIGYTTPDPFTWFYGPRPLSVSTSDTRINIVGQRAFTEKGENVGGGGEEASAAGTGLSEVELRGNFKTTAYWNPSVLTDENGDASLDFTLPDNLTSFRVMAVALTRDSLFGHSDTTFRVAKPLLLQASLPRFARVGDAFQAGVVVHNFSAERGDVTLAAEFKGITFADKDARRAFSLEPGASREVLYQVKAEATGRAVFSFRAVMGKASDGLETSLPIEAPRATETVALSGETTVSTEEKIRIPELYPDQSRLEVQASATALSGLKGSLAYLTDYPYLCIEQRLSAMLPYVLASDVIRDLKLSRMKPKEWEDFVQATIGHLSEYQKDSGGFGLWPDSVHESPYLTAYAVFGLLKARQAGYDVTGYSLSSGLSYLKGFLRLKNAAKKFPYSPKGLATTRAFAVYDLALAGQPEPAYASQLFAERKGLTVFGKAMLLKAMHLAQASPQDQAALLQELANNVKVTTSQAHFEDEEGRTDSWIFSSNLRTTAYTLQTLLEVGSSDPLLPGVARWIVEKQKAGRWLTTQENIYAFYALNTFYRTHEKVRPDFKVEMSLARNLVLKEEFRGPTTEIKTASAPLAGLKPGETVPLSIAKKGEGLLYYGARMTYVARKPLEARDEGLAVTRTFTTLDGRPVQSIKGGDVIVVKLELVVPQESLFVVVEDPLPGGFEAVNTSLATESTEQAAALEASGEERPWWVEGFNHVEMHDNRVLLFADDLPPGIQTYRYLARALTYGEFGLPGTKAEQMYAPEVFGRGFERRVQIIR